MKYLITIFLSAVVSLAGFLGIYTTELNQQQESFGANTVKTIGGQTYTLAGSGLSSSATSITLASLTIPQTGYELTDGDFSNTFYLTLEPGSRSRQEFVSCTTVTQNSDDTATLSGCTRGLLPFSPYTASSTYQFSHSGGTSVIFSNPPQLYEQATFKGNDETITGLWSFPTPLSNAAPATKAYVDGLVTGGSVTNVAVVIPGNAGETVATGTLVYLDGSDQEWKKVDVDTTTTYVDKFIGITQGNGTDGNTIVEGVLLYGRDDTQTGLTPGSTYYASSTAGVITTTVTNQPIGVAEDTGVLFVDPKLLYPTETGDNTFSGSNTFSGATTTFSGFVNFTGTLSGHASTTITQYTASTTWSKPAGLEYIIVEVIGGGGGGGSEGTNNGAGGGGGAGGYSKEILTAADLAATSTVTITVGAGGAGGAAGNNNGVTGVTTSFSSFLQATGGVGGTTSNSGGGGGAGGTGSGGDINITSESGESGYVDAGADTSVWAARSGGASIYGASCGGGGAGAISSGAGTAGNTGCVIIQEVF